MQTQSPADVTKERNGGGVIGAGDYKPVHDASIALVQLAAEYKDNFVAATSYPLPENGFTRCYIITRSGAYTGEALEDDLGNGRHGLSPLFFQGHEVIFAIRAMEERGR